MTINTSKHHKPKMQDTCPAFSAFVFCKNFSKKQTNITLTDRVIFANITPSDRAIKVK